MEEQNQKIELHNVRVHNLKSVSLTLEPRQLICFTGVSGSGKTSLAFDTIFVEGQRRYIESLSQHVRRFLGDLPKPDLDMASGITPTISIEQKTTGKNPRSTIGTITEIYDYFRVLWARAGIPHCPVSGEPVRGRSKEEIIEEVLKRPLKTRLIILAPYARNKKGEFKDDLEAITKKGFTRVRIDQTIWSLDQEIPLDKTSAHDVDIVVDRVAITPDIRPRLTESIFMALDIGEGSCIILDSDSNDEQLLSTKAYSAKSGISYPPLEPQDFSFNSPAGMCPDCQGMGVMHLFDLNLVIDPEKSIAQDCCLIASSYSTIRYGNIYDNLGRLYHFDVHTPWKNLSEAAKEVFLKGTQKKWTRMLFMHPETGATWHDLVQWKGVLHEAHKRYQEAKSDSYKKKLEQFMHKGVCQTCHGGRLKAYPAAALFCGKSISTVSHMTVEECLHFFKTAKIPPADAFIAKPLIKEIVERLSFLIDVGLDYLQMDRTAPTLSGGESQRVRLASQIGSGLVGATYILDEPSIGLHVRDNKKLIHSLENLRDKGNTVIVIEHDEETMRAADFIVDFGPKAGLQGGEIVYQGAVSGLMKCKQSLTGSYLAGRLAIEVPATRRSYSNFLEIHGARHNNLKNVSVKIPLGCFVAITGVSGSGKSSLFLETLFTALSNTLMKSELSVGDHDRITGIEHIDKIVEIDQSPIGRTPRSNPATYIKLFDEIRVLFSKLPQSLAKGFKPGRFSFNNKEGSCPECHGIGMLKLNMDFLEDSWVDCPLCQGQRFDQETLEIRYKGKNIRDVLEMDVKEAKEHFIHLPSIEKKLELLARVGLDYMKLGQPSTTLSGGEAQRIKLVKELSRPDTGKTVYILDEPTTGLHFHDMSHLIDVLQALVDKGNSVIVIEHNIDLIKTCDWVIEMGPESGKNGGKIIATGTPEEIARIPCATGIALSEPLHSKTKKQKKKSTWNNSITVTGAEQNNLKKCSATLPRGKTTVCVGPSGSGKSSFAFETLFAEGQRRYVESLSPYVRQFVKQMPKPKVEHIDGLPASVAIEQRLHSTNPRSTVGTLTEIYDYLRILFSRIGIPHCPKTKARIQAISKDHVVDRLLSYPQGEKLYILAPIEIKRTDNFEELCSRLQRQGYVRIRLNGQFHELESQIPYNAKRKNELFLVVDRFPVDPSLKPRMLEAVSVASSLGKQKLVVMRENGDVFFNLAFAVEETGESYPEITPQTFAFNTVHGMCPECQGLGFVWGIDVANLPHVTTMTPLQLVGMLWGEETFNRLNKKALDLVFKAFDLDPYTQIKKQPTENLLSFFNGSKKEIELKIDGTLVRLKWKGINNALAAVVKFRHESSSDSEIPLPEEWQMSLKENECASCCGTRLNPLARHVTIDNLSIADVSNLSISKASEFIQAIEIKEKEDLTLQQVHDELKARLNFLSDIGLIYLSLSRRASTLSGGEAQRVRLARQIGSGLTGVLYILDEPTIGLHPHDCNRLTDALDTLKTLGNSLVIVEHDPQMIMKADHVIEFGPGSGRDGGHIVASGTPKELLDNPKSLTGAYISGNQFQTLKKSKKKNQEKLFFTIKNASVNNLQNLSLQIPIGAFTCLTGVSGSGKSSLLDGVLREGVTKSIFQKSDQINSELFSLSGISDFKHLIVLDQRPMGHTLRSDVATYVDILTPIRHFFAALPDAKMRGLEPKHFSTYHKKGMCTACWGLGYKKIEMHFLPAVKAICPQCSGLRLNPAALAIQYKEKNLGQILQMSIDEVRELFVDHPKVCRLLDVLISVGLGYLNLGQEIQTLSGGESQRIKLSRELSKRTRGHTLYLFDEPTTGLHPQEIHRLVTIIYDLVSKGNTVIAIEHNLDFLQCADHLIDLGPGAGDLGGKIVAAGTPADIAKCKSSLTGRYLH